MMHDWVVPSCLPLRCQVWVQVKIIGGNDEAFDFNYDIVYYDGWLHSV